VIASCTPWIVVPRSDAIWEIETFMTLLSSTITNCAEARMTRAIHFMPALYAAGRWLWTPDRATDRQVGPRRPESLTRPFANGSNAAVVVRIRHVVVRIRDASDVL
jgi:hypothetical protein